MHVIVLASGPSVTQGQIEKTKGQNVITVNNMCFLAPWAQWHFAADYRWWKEYHGACTIPARYTLSKGAAQEFGATWVGQPVAGKYQASWSLGEICRATNSGMIAVNLAALLGFRRILMVGFDHKKTDDKAHCHPEYPEGFRHADGIETWLDRSPAIADDLMRGGIELINCTIDTALTNIPRMTLEDALCNP